MSARPARRGLLRFTALATAAVLTLGGASTALAQEDPTSATPTPTPSSTATATETTTTTTTTPPPSSSTPEPTPSSSTEPSSPATPVAPPAATVEPAKPDEKKVQTEQAAPDLQLSVRFDRPEYAQGQPLGLTVTVRNAGDAPANQIRFASELFSMYLTTGVDELISRPSLAPGESKTIKLGATPESQPSDRVAITVRAYVEGGTDKAPNDNQARAEAKIVKTSGRLSGVLYEDKNGNGVADPGESLTGNQQLKLTGGPDFPGSTFNVYDGRFSFWEIPAGTYQARFTGGYNSDRIAVKPGQFIVVKKGESTEVALQVGPALSRSLQIAGYSFDKARYTKGGPISVTVNLKNVGTTPISKLVAVCDPENDPATLDGTGEGWGELRPDRGGITIPAGETKAVTVTDVVPDVDYPTGKVYFACVFSVDGRNTDGQIGPIGMPGVADPGLTIGADVAGTIGRVSGRVLSNGTPVSTPPVKVVAFNPANNRIVGDGQTYDITGKWSISGVPQGKVALKVVGRWRFADGSTQRLVDVAGDQDVSVDLDVEAGPEVKDPTVFAPDLKVSVSFDKEHYDISDPVRMTLKVENVGTGKSPARGDWRNRYNEEQPYFDYQQYRRFVETPIELWPGESAQFTLVGKARDGGMDPEKLRTLRFLAEVGSYSGDPDQENNKAEARATVGWGTGSAEVFVYGDLNLNGKPDAGEELANRKVRLGGGRPWVNLYGRTDASGRVRFTNVPAGGYSATDEYDRESGWIEAYSNTDPRQSAVVNPGDEGTVVVRLVRPLSDKLKATLKFDQPSYPAGAAVGVTATITNNTDKPILVKADCGGSYGNYLGNDSDGWGALKTGGPGVEVAVGATYTHRVTAPMPAVAPDYGFIGLSCSFGPEGNFGNPWVRAQTRVPGATQTFRGLVVTGQYPDQQPVPHVKLVLLDPDTAQPVASTTTDADGRWVFPDLAVGPYRPVVVGPWRVRVEDWQEGEGFGNVRGRDDQSWIWVEPGPDVADPEGVRAPGGGGTTTVKKIKNTAALANTGVSVLGLVLFGGLLVLAGAAMRRRTAPR